MFETLKNAWKIKELRNKLLYTLGMLLVYRLLCFIPTPGVDASQLAEQLNRYSLLDYIQWMTGANFSNWTIMAMGITPYINSSIIMQLLCVAIPSLEQLNKSGEEGRKKIAQITRYVTVALGFVQAIALTYGLKASADSGFVSYLTIGFCLAAGTALAMWIGERITENGIGNGVSLLIFAGIVSRFATVVVARVRSVFTEMFSGTFSSLPGFLAILLISLVMIVGVVLVDMAERRIPVQYAKRMVGRKMYGGQSTHIPIKLNASGVLPLIFASAIMQFPETILQFISSKAATWWSDNLGSGTWWYIAINALLILGFTFFYSSITFNPKEMAENIQNNGGLIPGIRQGKATVDYITRINHRITLFGAIFLAVLALVPNIVYKISGVFLAFAGSSLLIAVSVAVETARTLESQLLMRHYRGFLK
ncbi:MAG: preprotein translocase subunit SecY [Clostridia bacterium]|nr:preprotein translocase subunit SecY [Clostridia bacterium]MCR4577100.1 preprotein translocase subunit SecY [Clostridiales bacterium]